MTLPPTLLPRVSDLPPEDAFSLLELLAVIALICIMAVLVVPAVSSISRSYGLTSTSQTVVNHLSQARQAAMTHGYPVQVRFYKLPAAGRPNSTPPTSFRAMQAFLESDPITSSNSTTTPLRPLTRPILFDSSVEIHADSENSTILQLPYEGAPQDSLAGYGKNYGYISFRFKPSGQADISSQTAGLVLVLGGETNSSTLPANFRSIEIDPITGSTREYSP